MAAPALSEDIDVPDNGTYLQLVNGATAASCTVQRPGTWGGGDPIDDLVVASFASGERWVRVGPEYRDPATGKATVVFNNVTTMTARLWRFPLP